MNNMYKCNLLRQVNRKLLLSLSLLLLVSASLTWGQSLPTGFNNSLVLNGYTTPMGTVFSADGKQLFVWDKAGRVWVSVWNGVQYVKQTAVVLDISPEVGNWRDFGLASICLDPNFATNGLIYLFYVVDRHHLMNFGTASYNAATNDYLKATISRVTRYKLVQTNNVFTADVASRKVLLGETKSTGIPLTHESHAGGTILFGADGTLLVSTGDNASYNVVDKGSSSDTYWQTAINDGIMRPNENVGSFRSQMITSLCGKILRLDPNTGDGVSSNPFYNSANPRAAASRVWALGFRNPNRMGLQPGTGSMNPADGNPGTLLVGDVGWAIWEEVHLIKQGGENAGWPIYEGIQEHSSYAAAAQTLENRDEPNPTNTCNKPYLTFANLLKQASIGTTTVLNPCSNQPLPGLQRRYVHNVPIMDWHHSQNSARVPVFTNTTTTVAQIGATGSSATGTPFKGNCVTGGAYYAGTKFPAAYRNLYYFGDYGANWIKAAAINSNGTVTSVSDFLPAGGTNGVVDIEYNALDGSLYYTNINNGEIRKISYGLNQPPIATISVDKALGNSPLTVQFKGDGSTDPDGDALTYVWNFGDGTSSTDKNPVHTFTAVGTRSFTVQLTVTDTQGQTASQQLLISLNNSAPTVKIASPIAGSLYALNKESTYQLKASVTDEAVGSLTYSWQVVLRHNNHQHPEPALTEASPIVKISPVGCDGDTYYYLIKVQVTDNGGLTATDSVKIYPDCASANLAIRNLTATLNATTNVNLNWSSPTAPFDEVLVVVKAGTGFLDRPSGTNYTANPDFTGNGSAIEGGKVVYRGTASMLTVTNLNQQTTYYFRVYTRAGDAWSGGVGTSLTTGVKQLDPALCYKITGRISNKVLGVEGGSTANGAAVKQRTYTGQQWQKWKFQSVGINTYQLVTVHSGKVLDIKDGSTANGALPIQWTNAGSNNQKWVTQLDGQGYYSLKAVHSDKVLDLEGSNQNEGGNVIQYTPSGQANQQWSIEAVGCANTVIDPNACYKVTNRNSNKALGVEGGSTADGAVVKQRTYSGQQWQKWKFQSVGANTYQLVAMHSNKVLDVKDGSTANGALPIQWTNGGRNNQKWIVQLDAQTYFSIKAVHSGKVLDVEASNQNEGGNVIQYTPTGLANQQWNVEPVGCASGSRVKAEAESESSLTVYPNPAQDYVAIDIPVYEAATIHLDLITLAGNKVRSETLSLENSTTYRVDVADLPAGMYLIRVQIGAQLTKAHRLVINR
ncbi:hypothetical protein GCM10028807_10260 [Spirosoma daeguense]